MVNDRALGLSSRIISRDDPAAFLHRAVDLGVRFKADETLYARRGPAKELRDLLVHDLPSDGTSLPDLLDEFEVDILPWCKNEASPRFLGFADTGDDPAALAGELLAAFTQQNLINQGFDSPSATFVDVTVLRWLRDLLGYSNPAVRSVGSVWEVGGIITPGGTASNTVAMMLARERYAPGTMHSGMARGPEGVVLVPAGIGHYSVKSALSWIGMGDATVEVPTRSFRYDPQALASALTEHGDRVAAVVAYAGDSRTQTVDHLDIVRDLVRRHAPKAWLHADACWGLAAACSPDLSHLLTGIADYDSITVDPHKVLTVPYSLSALLVRDPQVLRSVSSHSDLIMQEDFAFGQVTPFVGSRPWASLKLWMMMRHHGRSGLARIIQDRIALRDAFLHLIDSHDRLLRLHEPDMTAVAFVYLPHGIRPGQASAQEVESINRVNEAIHDDLLTQGRWFLHQFGLPDDDGHLRRGAFLRPLRFVAGNLRVTDEHLREALRTVVTLGRQHEETVMTAMSPMPNGSDFRSVYEESGIYDDVLLRHYFEGFEDTDLVSRWLNETYGSLPREAGGFRPRGLRIVEFGCGTGRVTARTAPYAATLLGSDYSPVMIEAFAHRFPRAQTLCADTRHAVDTLLSNGQTGTFDLVSAFWSLSYPLGACFETLTAEGIRPATDLQTGRRAASALVTGLVDLLAPGGHLVALLFDSDSPEQQLVTWAWEKIAPTPFGDRAYTRTVLYQELLAAEKAGRGGLTWSRLPGVAVAPNRSSAIRWFAAAHFKDLPQLTRDREVMEAVEDFVDRWTGPDGMVTLPAGVHFLDFHRDAIGAAHLPPGGER